MMVLEPLTSESLPDSVVNQYRLLAIAAHFRLPEALDKASLARLHRLHESLAGEIAGIGLPISSRHNLLMHVHRNAMQAGQRIDYPPLTLSGAVGLLRNPQLWTHSQDRISAASTILETYQETMTAAELIEPAFYRSPVMRFVRKTVWQELDNALANNLTRFIAPNLTRLYQLIAEYVDYLALRPVLWPQALKLISKFQGGITTAAYYLVRQSDNQSELVYQLLDDMERLLHYKITGLSHNDVFQLSTSSVARDSRASAPNVDAHRPVARQLPWKRDAGYEHTEFDLVTDEGDYLHTSTIYDLRSELDADEAAILLFVSRKWLYSSVIAGSSGNPQFRRLCPTDRLTRYADPMWRILQSGNERFLVRGKEFAWMFEEIIGPTMEGALDNVTKLIFLDSQTGLPLHLAYDRSDDRFLIDHYSVAYTHSSHIYGLISTRSLPMGGRALLIDGSTSASRALTNVLPELQGIARTLSERFQVEGPYARREATLLQGEQVGVFHYSGHMERLSSESRWNLMLRDGIAAPGEILGRIGDHTELVSLFSCYSAAQGGDGYDPIGLSALIAAVGARNFIGCLWAIPDKVAASIAKRLYREWVGGASVPEAMRRAALEWRDWSPGVWGSVVCYGSHKSVIPDRLECQ